MSSRRDFIKSGCAACVLTAAGVTVLEGCASALPIIKNTGTKTNELQVAADSFLPGKGNMLVIRTNQLEYDVLLIKNADSYKALYLRCTHEGVGLTPAAGKIFCSAHGSAFDLNGNVIREPALRPLKSFPTEVLNNQIIIRLS